MDAQQFAYWLQGFAELSGDAPPTKAQWKSIREHLGLVFTKVTPPVYDPKRDGPAIAQPAIIPHINDVVRWPQVPRASDPRPSHPTVTCSILSGGYAAQSYC